MAEIDLDAHVSALRAWGFGVRIPADLRIAGPWVQEYVGHVRDEVWRRQWWRSSTPAAYLRRASAGITGWINPVFVYATQRTSKKQPVGPFESFEEAREVTDGALLRLLAQARRERYERAKHLHVKGVPVRFPVPSGLPKGCIGLDLDV